VFLDKPTKLVACCEKSSAAAAHHPIIFAVFRIHDRRRVANRTRKFPTHRFCLVELATLDPLAVHNGWSGKTFRAGGALRTPAVVFNYY
jgi:hypothetical protein